MGLKRDQWAEGR